MMGGLGIDIDGVFSPMTASSLKNRTNELKLTMKRLIQRLRGQSQRLQQKGTIHKESNRVVMFPLLHQLKSLVLHEPNSDSLFSTLSELSHHPNIERLYVSPPSTHYQQPYPTLGANTDMMTTPSYTGPWDAIDYESGEFGSSHPLIRGYYRMYSHQLPPQNTIDWTIFYISQYEILFDLSIKIIELKKKMLQIGSWVYQLDQIYKTIQTIPITLDDFSGITHFINGYQGHHLFTNVTSAPTEISDNKRMIQSIVFNIYLTLEQINQDRLAIPTTIIDQLSTSQTNWLSSIPSIPNLDYTRESLDYMSHVKHILKLIDNLLEMMNQSSTLFFMDK